MEASTVSGPHGEALLIYGGFVFTVIELNNNILRHSFSFCLNDIVEIGRLPIGGVKNNHCWEHNTVSIHSYDQQISIWYMLVQQPYMAIT